MGQRISYELDGIGHGGAPIPMGARVGGLFVSSGVMGADPATGSVPADGTRQVELVFANAKALLDRAGMAADTVAYVAVLLADDSLRPAINAEWVDWFPDPHDRPARHITVQSLPNELLIQLQLFAFSGQSEGG